MKHYHQTVEDISKLVDDFLWPIEKCICFPYFGYNVPLTVLTIRRHRGTTKHIDFAHMKGLAD